MRERLPLVRMDAIAGFLNGPRARGAFLLRMVVDPPWSIRVEDEAPLTLVVAVRGSAWITPDDPTQDAVQLLPGDVSVVLGPGHYGVADAPHTPPSVTIDRHQRCAAPDGSEVAIPRTLGVRTWGTNPDGATMLLVGTYAAPSELSARVLRALPPLLTVRANQWEGNLIEILHDEIGREAPGQESVLDRLLDLLLVAALRAWFASAGQAAPGWFRAQADPVVGRALALLHDEPARAWTVGTLAHEVGISRAALARRFHDQVGEPPMAYLTSWRLALAADLLHEPGATVGSVADAVGYGTPFALSTAFKRVRGISPAAHRARIGRQA